MLPICREVDGVGAAGILEANYGVHVAPVCLAMKAYVSAASASTCSGKIESNIREQHIRATHESNKREQHMKQHMKETPVHRARKRAEVRGSCGFALQ